jgi:hypothetical protein
MLFEPSFIHIMLERDIENLIAAFPEEFFPGQSLVLRGRQQAFAGVGRFDLLFTDPYKTNVLVELKAVTAKYENATQLAKYNIKRPSKVRASAISSCGWWRRRFRALCANSWIGLASSIPRFMMFSSGA